MTTLLLTAGVGPVECRLAVQGIAAALIAEAEELGLEAFVAEAVEDHGGSGWVSALLCAEGEGALAWAGAVVGSLRWTCPSTRREGRGRKNWFVGAVLLNEERAEGVALRDEDVRFESFRAGGPGGQHVDRTDSAVRAVHIPTGLRAVARAERSQRQNKEAALRRLKELLGAVATARAAAADKARRGAHHQLERGGERRAYEGPAFRRVF